MNRYALCPHSRRRLQCIIARNEDAKTKNILHLPNVVADGLATVARIFSAIRSRATISRPPLQIRVTLLIVVSLRAHEGTKSGSRVCSGHGHARHARARANHSGFAEADPEFSRRQNGECGVVAGLFRRRFCTHAVCFCSRDLACSPIVLVAGRSFSRQTSGWASTTSSWRSHPLSAGFFSGKSSRALPQPASVLQWPTSPMWSRRKNELARLARLARLSVLASCSDRRSAVCWEISTRDFLFGWPVVLSLTNGIYCYFFVPESLPSDRRKPFELGRANPVGSLVLLRSHPELFRLATIQFIGYIAHEVFEIWALYTIFRYAWSSGMVGLSLAIVGALSVAISGGLVPVVVRRLGERRTLYIGQFFGGAGMLIAGLARTGTLFMASIPIMMLWTISGPAAQGMMTHRVSEREQGALQGAITSLRSVAMLFGPLLFPFTFAFFIDPGRA